LSSGTATLSAERNLNLIESQLTTTGNMNLLAQNTVVVRDSVANPFLAVAGGNLYIQGNEEINILALNHLSQTPFVSGGDFSLVSDGIIYGDAHYASTGRFSVLNLNGGGGNYVALYDPIISSTQDVTLGSYTGPSLLVESLGSITVTGDITITGRDTIIGSFCTFAPAPCSDDAADLGRLPTLILRAGRSRLVEPSDGYLSPRPPFTQTGGLSSPGNVTVNGTIVVGSSGSVNTGGPVTISATGNIQTGVINTSGNSFIGDNSPPSKNVMLEAGGNITTGNINASANFLSTNFAVNAGNITLRAASGNIITGSITSFASLSQGQNTARGGSVTLQAPTGSISTDAIDSSAFVNQGVFALGGSVSLNAGNPNNGNTSACNINGCNINFESILTQGNANVGIGRGGDVSILTNGVVRGTGIIPNANSSIPDNTTIFTQGQSPIQAGSVVIQHNGGPDNIRFTVGRTTTPDNGIRGRIVAGVSLNSETIPDSIDIPDNYIFPWGDLNEGGISITFINQAPTLTANLQLSNTQQNAPIPFTFGGLNLVSDSNGDNTSIIIGSIPAGATLIRQSDGMPVEPGTNVSLDEVLVYTPPVDARGQIEAFTISASDGVSRSTPPQSVSINVAAPPPGNNPGGDPGNNPGGDPGSNPGGDPGSNPGGDPGNNPGQPSRLSADLLHQETQIPALPLTRSLPPVEIDAVFGELDARFTNSFVQYFGQTASPPTTSLNEAREMMQKIQQETGAIPALIYVFFYPTNLASSQESLLPQPNDQLELVLVTGKGKAIARQVPVTREQVLKVAQEFRSTVTNVRNNLGYLSPSQQLYQWLVAPLEADLQAQKVNNLVFVMDTGLRSLPVAALHDGQGFLVERYSVGLMPSLSLTDTRYVDIRNAKVLAMGADNFTDQKPLPAVPMELALITGQLWSGKSFLNEAFTLEKLKQLRASEPFGIIHLATHGAFKAGKPSNSYIQLWNKKLQLDQVRQLGLNDPPAQLLVLSACRTALGDEEAELGFAGLAVQAGVKSALASLWSVDDEATLGLMASFYEQLKKAPIKAEALRQAQLAMLTGKTRMEGGKLLTEYGNFPLSPQLAKSGNRNLIHP
ncbi:MAG TPA: CHAT domain-containing protein, partial [Leptolyngbyaceae cyanobacterium]